jgi:hypothetical protein
VKTVVENGAFQLFVAGIETVGSSLGLFRIAQIIHSGSVNGIGWIIILFFSVLYLFGFIAAWQTARSARDMVDWNLIFWAFQVPVVASGIISYQFFAAVVVFVAFELREPKVTFGGVVGSDFLFSIGPNALGYRIGFNVVALTLFLIFAFGRARKGQNLIRKERRGGDG